MRIIYLFGLITCLALSACRAGSDLTHGPAEGDLAYERPRLNDQATRRLAAPVALDEGTYTLVQVARAIQRQTGVPVRFQWDGLAELGIEPSQIVEVEEGTLAADRLLATLLLELAPPRAPSSWEVYPTYLLVDGTAVIGTNRSLKPLAAAVDWPDGGQRVIDEDEAVRRMLRDTIIKPERGVIALSLVAEQLDAAGFEVVVHRKNLEIVGIDWDAATGWSGSAVRADNYLESALRILSAEQFDEGKAGYYIQGGVIHITTLGEMIDNTETRVYDVRDLVDRPFGPLFEAVYAEDELALSLLHSYQFSWLVELGGVKRVWDLNDVLGSSNSGSPPVTRAIEIKWNEVTSFRTNALEQLSQLIQDAAGAPSAWLDEKATLQELNGNFIIRASPATHDEIEFLLDRVREARAGRVYKFMRDLDVARLLKQAEALRAGGNYQEALEAAQAAVAVDPASTPARALRDVLADTIARRNAGGH